MIEATLELGRLDEQVIDAGREFQILANFGTLVENCKLLKIGTTRM